MKIKCKISDLETIVKLVSLKGKDLTGKEYSAVEDCVINATAGKLIVSAMDLQGVFGAKVDYKTVTVIEEGQLPIGDLETFSKFLSRFGTSDEVVVSISGNRIVIERESPKKIAKLPLVDYESIASKDAPFFATYKKNGNGFPETPKNHWNLKFTMKADDVTDLFEDGNLISQRVLPWVFKDDKLQVSIVDPVLGSFEAEVAVSSIESDPSKVGPHKTFAHFGRGVDNVFSNINGLVKVFMIDNDVQGPIAVEQSTENYDFTALIAPIIMNPD